MAKRFSTSEAGLQELGMEASISKYKRSMKRERNIAERETHRKFSSKRPRLEYDDDDEYYEYSC